MNARDAAPAPRPTGPSFLRRHPILAGFGVLAALSLFAAYWPLSAVVTGVIVAGRATGADRVALNALRRGAAAVARRLRRSTPPPDAPAPTPGPPTVSGPPAHGARDVGPHVHQVRARTLRAPRRQRERAAAEPAAPGDRGLS